MESPVKMLQQLRKRVQSVTYGSPIYRMMLDQGPMPERLRLSIPDPWPGDAKLGQSLIAGQPDLFEGSPPSRHTDFKKDILTHDVLRHLRAVGTDMARRKTVAFIQDWIDGQEQWDEENWDPPVLATRLANWIAFYDFYSTAGNDRLTQKMISSAVRQLRHLQYTAQANLIGLEGFSVIKGLVFGGLALIDREKSLGLALDLLMRQMEAEILPDGGHVSRSPTILAEALRILIDIRSALCAAKMDVPLELSLAITRMVPALKLFRHGDGGVALFHGAMAGTSLLLEASLTLAQAKGRVLKRLQQTGYERLTAGRSLLLVDVAPPALRPYDLKAHAGLMAFEFSVGRERILTNCGAAPAADMAWHRAVGATAAHNTVIIEETNACELLPEGGIGARPRDVTSQRYEQEGEQSVEIVHDGYLARHKVRVKRTLSLSEDGGELKGREIIAGPVGRDFTVRWHMHPDIQALLAQGGGAALLRTPSGIGWRLRVKGQSGETLALESSVYCGEPAMRRTLQLRISGQIRENPAIVEWTLTREKIKKGS